MKKLLLVSLLGLAANAQAFTLPFIMQVDSVEAAQGTGELVGERFVYGELDMTINEEGDFLVAGGIDSFELTHVVPLHIQETYQIAGFTTTIHHRYEAGSGYTFEPFAEYTEAVVDDDNDTFVYTYRSGEVLNDGNDVASFAGGYGCQSDPEWLDACSELSGPSIDGVKLDLTFNYRESVDFGLYDLIDITLETYDVRTGMNSGVTTTSYSLYTLIHDDDHYYEYFPGPADEVSSVPLPGAVWLFGSAIAGLGFVSRRKARKVA
ncbi:putative secreted protein [Sinobacterium caligoides]|uniref:Putative secreted protein n=1 Tax=Sinobacterium caligoides TaxID=933926 RepID=A0A3N2DKA3_9GAMM|nr:VPLPA-CTERM sorting domain-containing protein [Sinobacterium caligoides]ROS00217.1 putative secreted protein [Sinobacterium caligoides]